MKKGERTEGEEAAKEEHAAARTTEAAKPDRHIRGYLGKRFEGHRVASRRH